MFTMCVPSVILVASSLMMCPFSFLLYLYPSIVCSTMYVSIYILQCTAVIQEAWGI